MKTRVFLDTNVILDFLDGRKGFYKSAAEIITLADNGNITIIASPVSFVNINYILTRTGTAGNILDKLKKFKIISEVCTVDGITIEKALYSPFSDFEDAVQYYGALDSKCDIIITRNGKDFKESAIPVMNPNEYLSSLKRP
jgi:predicted nucleic acid-binding protein